MKSSEMLKKAKKEIENRNSCFICTALEDLYGRSAVEHLVKWIRKLLEGFYSYEGWLIHNKYPSDRESSYQGRLAWLDWMIAECKKIGD